jgi:hypothetical protein
MEAATYSIQLFRWSNINTLSAACFRHNPFLSLPNPIIYKSGAILSLNIIAHPYYLYNNPLGDDEKEKRPQVTPS